MALLDRLTGPSPREVAPEDLEELLASADLVREEKTGIAGTVRILDLGGALFVQERTPDRVILLRPRADLEEATAFVERRLRTYDRMWDG